MGGGYDFLAVAAPGATFFTRDRRQAIIGRIDREAGRMHGEVPMLGACSWRADGVYVGSPCGAAGPLDLMPPGAVAAPSGQRRTTMKDAIAGNSRSFCCD